MDKLYRLLLDDISLRAKKIYEKFWQKAINENHTITVGDLENKIRETVNPFFNDYLKHIRHSNLGLMIRVDLKEKDIELFENKAHEKLNSSIDEYSAKYNNFLQQKYNKQILSMTRATFFASIFASVIPIGLFFLDYYTRS